MKKIPPQETLNELLTYCEASGDLFWNERSAFWFEQSDRFSPQARANIWNGRNAGKKAFARKTPRGYMAGCLLGRPYLAHRIIWKMVWGEEPNTIDHINGDKSDNRLANLRNVDMAEQGRNKALYTTNRSGHVGVKKSHYGVWIAYIWDSGKQVYLGSFRKKKDAIEARMQAEIKIGFHENHGRTF